MRQSCLIILLLLCENFFAQPLLHLDFSTGKAMPDHVTFADMAAPLPEIQWATGSSKDHFAIDFDGKAGGAPLQCTDPVLHNLCSKGFTVEMRIFCRLRDFNRTADSHQVPFYTILHKQRDWTDGFRIIIRNRDLSFVVMKGKKWEGWHVNFNLSELTQRWLDLALVFDPENELMIIYLDGKRCSTSKIDGAGTVCPTPLLIGGEDRNWRFDGLMEHLKITPKAKSPEELSTAKKDLQRARRIFESL